MASASQSRSLSMGLWLLSHLSMSDSFTPSSWISLLFEVDLDATPETQLQKKEAPGNSVQWFKLQAQKAAVAM